MAAVTSVILFVQRRIVSNIPLQSKPTLATVNPLWEGGRKWDSLTSVTNLKRSSST
jgi:hypothetical protein